MTKYVRSWLQTASINPYSGSPIYGHVFSFTNILIISFSARQDGNCDGISRMIREHYDHSCTVFRFSQQQIHPCGGCRYECFGKETTCPYIADPEYGLLDAICNHDLTYFVIPNYCDYPCANYFIFNERSQCYFQHKPERLDRFINVKKKRKRSSL